MPINLSVVCKELLHSIKENRLTFHNVKDKRLDKIVKTDMSKKELNDQFVEYKSKAYLLA